MPANNGKRKRRSSEASAIEVQFTMAVDNEAQPVDFRPIARLLIEIVRAGAKPRPDTGDATVHNEEGDL